MTSILNNNNNNNNIAVESLSPVNWDAHKFLADLGRKISRVSGVCRRQVNHVFVLTHFCLVISFQFCFVAQQLRVGRPLRTLASPFFLNFLNIFPTVVFRGFKKTKKIKNNNNNNNNNCLTHIGHTTTVWVMSSSVDIDDNVSTLCVVFVLLIKQRLILQKFAVILHFSISFSWE